MRFQYSPDGSPVVYVRFRRLSGMECSYCSESYSNEAMSLSGTVTRPRRLPSRFRSWHAWFGFHFFLHTIHFDQLHPLKHAYRTHASERPKKWNPLPFTAYKLLTSLQYSRTKKYTVIVMPTTITKMRTHD